MDGGVKTPHSLGKVVGKLVGALDKDSLVQDGVQNCLYEGVSFTYGPHFTDRWGKLI